MYKQLINVDHHSSPKYTAIESLVEMHWFRTWGPTHWGFGGHFNETRKLAEWSWSLECLVFGDMLNFQCVCLNSIVMHDRCPRFRARIWPCTGTHPFAASGELWDIAGWWQSPRKSVSALQLFFLPPLFIVSICFHPCYGRNDHEKMTGLRVFEVPGVAVAPSGRDTQQAFLQRSERLAAWGLGRCTAMSLLESGHMRLGDPRRIRDEAVKIWCIKIMVIINFPIIFGSQRQGILPCVQYYSMLEALL